MAIKKIQMIPPGYVDILHPETDSSVVLMGNGDTLEQFKGATPQKTTANITYYIATTGSDSNNGLTSGTAFRTIGKISSVLPQIINQTVTINVADGTYNESVSLYGYLGSGSLNIIGNVTTPANVKINDIALYDCKCSTTVKGFTGLSTTVSTFRFYSCFGFMLQTCVSTSTGTQSTVYVSQSLGRISSCTCSNKYYGICVDSQSVVNSNNNIGSGNNIGVSASNGSILSTTGTKPTGTSSYQIDTGGKVLADTQPSLQATNGYRYNDDGTIEQWGTIDITANTSSITLTFPLAFPNATRAISFTNIFLNKKEINYSTGSLEKANTIVYPLDMNTNGVPTVAVRATWRAIGY